MNLMQNPLASSWRRTRLPLLLQNEIAECGLACLAMVACYHGHTVSVLELRRRFCLSSKGLTLKVLAQHAQSMNLAPRALRADLEDLPQLTMPCILHWQGNHFVVLKAVRGQRVLIHDPVQGARTLSYSEVSSAFTGVVLELQPQPQFARKQHSESLSLTALLRGFSDWHKALAHLLLLTMALQLFTLLSPYFMQLVLDKVLVGRDTALLTVLAVAFLLLGLSRIGVETVRSLVVLHFGAHFSLHISSALCRHLLRLPLDYFQKRQGTDVLSRFNSLEQIRQLFTNGLVEAFVDAFVVTGVLIMMLVYSRRLAVVAIVALVLYWSLRVLLFKPLKDATERNLIMAARRDSVFLESLRTITAIKIFGRESPRFEQWQHHQVATINASQHSARLHVLFRSGFGTLATIEYVLLVALGAQAVLAQQLSSGMLLAFLAFRDQFNNRGQALIDKAMEWRMLQLHLTRIADIALSDAESEPALETQMVKPSGGLSLREIGFRYAPHENDILQRIDMDVMPGEVVAIVGPSGCGKSTLLRLMMGLLTPTHGHIYVDGVELSQFGLHRYRRSIAAVLQEDHLMVGTLRDNICFFDSDPDETRLLQALELACIKDEVLALPMALESLVGEMSSGFSGGQVQRLLLARALYTQPQLLFLDEASSALDIDNEHRVNLRLRALGITRIMVAHRPETIRMADRIIDLGAAKSQTRAA